MELDKFIIRRQALGSDRFNRRYWWGVAGVRGAVIAELLSPEEGPSTVSIIEDHVRQTPPHTVSRPRWAHQWCCKLIRSVIRALRRKA